MYAKFTDTGINPLEAAKRLNIDWDSAAEIEGVETDEAEVPPAVVGIFTFFYFKLDTICTFPDTFKDLISVYHALYFLCFRCAFD